MPTNRIKQNSMTDEPKKILNFPCDFPIKVMGKSTENFESLALEIIHKHVPTLEPDALRSRKSKDGTYISLTATVHVDSQDQLDALYQALSACEDVLMTL